MALIERRGGDGEGWPTYFLLISSHTPSSLPRSLAPSLCLPSCLPGWLPGWLVGYLLHTPQLYLHRLALLSLSLVPFFSLLSASSHLLSSHLSPASSPSPFLSSSSSSPSFPLLGGVFPFNTSWHLQMLRACAPPLEPLERPGRHWQRRHRRSDRRSATVKSQEASRRSPLVSGPSRPSSFFFPSLPFYILFSLHP